MSNYLLRRILLLPLTLFAIVLVNFVILNLVPGDPVNVADRSSTGDLTRNADTDGSMEENHHLQFREHYGLTLPILLNNWPTISADEVRSGLDQLLTGVQNGRELSVQKSHDLRVSWGDRARYIMPLLLERAEDPELPLNERRLAANLFIRGGTQMGYVGPTLSTKQKQQNRIIAQSNQQLMQNRVSDYDDKQQIDQKVAALSSWYESQGGEAHFVKSGLSRLRAFFLETRFARYLTRVVMLDFGTLRNDSNKTVISEVAKRIKYSLTLAVVPMLITFVLCQVFGMVMAVKHNRWPDISLNILFLILFAVPIFVVAPFLIEKVALHHTFPFTDIPIPYSGFHSKGAIYNKLTSGERLADTVRHILLPLIAVMYGTLAIQARLSRTAFLEVLRQDWVKTAHAKGLPLSKVLIKHVGRNGAITIVTSLATSLGVIMGGSLIVETVFEINGFGRFFYEAILNRDYNVVLFSAFAGSLLTLVGYIIADIAYTLLDPRVNFS
ncbi:MAG: hypothetical protein S4CHLAM81_09050 [Chlamydiales bacterium]|nr:hypothetical protein [Chlamydiales bacterium]MCH9635684.1 hypothetical protein [Chlamydiales bacterium]MCH9703482.1 ABC transporter permease [Chlamydiota bacterium]